jgi:phosphoribosylamine--glycine ligase
MRVLVLGSGGREHTLVWKLSQSPQVKKIYALPGNGGMAKVAQCEPIDPLDFSRIISFVKKEKIDLTLVGPEAPLVGGIVDLFKEENLAIFGPTKQAARLEGSKIFAKEFMRKYNLPTANFEVFSDFEKAFKYVEEFPQEEMVVKVDGLAGGKGALVCQNKEEAKEALDKIFKKKIFGQAGEKVIIEDKLKGEEATVLALVDGETILPLPSSQDHKPVYDGDRGPNTGGMGAYSPAPVVDEKIWQEIEEKIFSPFVKGLKAEGISYQGVIYFGLMLTKEGVKILEFNCRFGDPEAQAVFPLIETDLVEISQAVREKRLSSLNLKIKEGSSVCVVLASAGYPGKYEKGKKIKGLEEAEKEKGIYIFHAGTKKENNQFYTNGGRVLGITAYGETLPQAVKQVYQAVEKVYFDGCHYRKDIAQKALRRLEISPGYSA